MMDLLSEGVGGRVVTCNDEFFAEASNLMKEGPPLWDPDRYTDRGKWMDGWETRRRREPGHDWCILALGIPGVVRRVTIDTSHFTGNYPESFSLEGSDTADDHLDEAVWFEIVPQTPLQGDAVATFEISSTHRATHLRLNIYPDGGVARLRVEGDPLPPLPRVCPDGVVDLASAILGGEAVDASNAHYSHPSNMLKPIDSRGMWDGWETRRRRGPGNDWAVVRLGLSGVVESVVVDTSHFKGNAPGWVSLSFSDDGESWETPVDRVPVAAHHRNEIILPRPVHASFVRLDIHPDGGVARLRVMGRADREAAGRLRMAYVDSLPPDSAERFFRTACGSRRWVDAMVAGRPYRTVEGLFAAADRAFEHLSEADWLEAFASHPRIGERGDAVSQKEQAGAASASREVINRLAEVNRAYEERFGFIYIVFASGRSAEEMLEIAERRLANTREEEIDEAAREQRKITMKRLRRMTCQEAG
ncbi:MAG: allantoicase [Actinomycetes bacterium]|jgi:allantoicase|nr:MAG: bifunctional allantoicase/OHCU decarboxylase [Actinomycetota bacterium]